MVRPNRGRVVLKLVIPAYSESRVLVLGDLMLDRYWSGSTSRISPEAPVPVVHVKGSVDRPGGASNVALNVAELGGQTRLIGIVGDDEEGMILQKSLEQRGVICCFQIEKGLAPCVRIVVCAVAMRIGRQGS